MTVMTRTRMTMTVMTRTIRNKNTPASSRTPIHHPLTRQSKKHLTRSTTHCNPPGNPSSTDATCPFRLSSGGAVTSNSTQFKVIDRSFWAQVEGTVRHDAALLPRPTPDAVSNALPPRPSTSLPPTPPSLFDDSKIYRHMLQDFLTLSTEGHRSGEGGAAEAAA